MEHNVTCITLLANSFCLEIILYYTDKSCAAVAEKLDGRTSRPGPVGISFEIIDAQIVHDDDDKYVVSILRLC